MSGKGVRPEYTNSRLPESDKENKRIFANLQVNTLDKEFQDPHIFQLPKQIPDLQPETDSTRFTRSSPRPSLLKTDLSPNMLISALKEEIELKFAESLTNQHYKYFTNLRARCEGSTSVLDQSSATSREDADSGESSVDSTLELSRYNLYSQNLIRRRPESKLSDRNEIEQLLGKLVQAVAKTPQAGRLLSEKTSNSHKLFCQLLKNVACDRSSEKLAKGSGSHTSREKDYHGVQPEIHYANPKKHTSHSNPKKGRMQVHDPQGQTQKKRSNVVGSSSGRPQPDNTTSRDRVQNSGVSRHQVKATPGQAARAAESDFQSTRGHLSSQNGAYCGPQGGKTSTRAKCSPPLATSSSMRGLLGGKLTLKQKSQLGDGLQSGRGVESNNEVSPGRSNLMLSSTTSRTLKKISTEVNPVENLKNVRHKLPQQPQESSKQRLMLNRLDKSKILNQQHASLKTFVTSSFAGLSLNHSGMMSLTKQSQSRRQSPEDSSKLAKQVASQSILSSATGGQHPASLGLKSGLQGANSSSGTNLAKRIGARLAQKGSAAGPT